MFRRFVTFWLQAIYVHIYRCNVHHISHANTIDHWYWSIYTLACTVSDLLRATTRSISNIVHFTLEQWTYETSGIIYPDALYYSNSMIYDEYLLCDHHRYYSYNILWLLKLCSHNIAIGLILLIRFCFSRLDGHMIIFLLEIIGIPLDLHWFRHSYVVCDIFGHIYMWALGPNWRIQRIYAQKWRMFMFIVDSFIHKTIRILILSQQADIRNTRREKKNE